MREIYGTEKQMAYADGLITTTLAWIDGLSELAKCDKTLYDVVQSYRNHIVGRIDSEDAAPVIIDMLKKIDRLKVIDIINRKAYKKGSCFSLSLNQNIIPETEKEVKTGWHRHNSMLTQREKIAIYIAKTHNKSNTFDKEEHSEEIESLLNLPDKELIKTYNDAIDERRKGE